MRILYYNWVQFDNENNVGGGVNVYQRNLIDYLVNNTEYEIYFLSAGWKYNPFKNKAYINSTVNMFGDRCKSFEIINSPIMSPAYAVFMNPQKYIEDEESVELLDKFIIENGEFDVIHINNFEGISVNVLKLKKKYPNTRFIVSLHNYQLICPMVQYFQNHKKCVCNDFDGGKECLRCADSLPSKKEYYKRVKNYYYGKIGKNFKFLKLPVRIACRVYQGRIEKYLGASKNMLPEQYVRFRKHNIECINKYADCVLAVSDRVREIIIAHGVNPDIVKTLYIGTKFAENELKHSVAQNSKPFTIAYLGYERVDKGFFFLIDALSKLDKNISKNINIVFAVPKLHKKRLSKLVDFNKIIVYDGYTHKELPSILENVNLGIVPVLWEDNLPQVAIEMVASGVPVLCSDLGGASELCASELFKFKAGSIESFIDKLTLLSCQPELLKEYWKKHPDLVTMAKHKEELDLVYNSL